MSTFFQTLVVTAAFKPREQDKGHFQVTTVRLGHGDPCGIVTEIVRDGAGFIRHNATSWARLDCQEWIENVRKNPNYECVSTLV